MDFIAIVLSIVLTGLLGFVLLDIFLRCCGVSDRPSFIAGLIFGILCAIFLSVASARWLLG